MFPSLRSPGKYRRLGVLLSLGLWIAATLAPCAQVTEASRYSLRNVDAMHGWRLAALGWLGPLGLSFAWYANVPYFYSAWKLFQKQPARRAALAAFCLALTVLIPHAIYSEVDGWHRAYFVGSALWLWLCAIAINLAMTRIPFSE
jgi:hypothetical protein